MKVLVVIRHGESEYNAAVRNQGQWSDPKLYDPSLTVRGCQQARRLRQQLAAELKNRHSLLLGKASTVWVTSPLRRCIQTFLLSCPLLPETAADNGSACNVKTGAVKQVQDKMDALRGSHLPSVKIVRCCLIRSMYSFVFVHG